MSVFNVPLDTSWFGEYNSPSKIKELFKKNKFRKQKFGKVKFIFVPHAGLTYSGLCATSAYQYVIGKSYDNVYLLCTNHRSANNYIPTFNKVNIFGKTIEIDNSLNIEKDRQIFEQEHSFFVQLPFLYFINFNKLIPIIIGKDDDEIVKQIKLDNSLVICTSDLSHVNGHFEYQIKENVQNEVRELDSKVIRYLCDQKINISDVPACGIEAIKVFRKIIPDDVYPRLSCYYTSLQNPESFENQYDYIKPLDYDPGSSCVSYASMIYTSKKYIDESSTRTMKYLLTRFEEIALTNYAMVVIKNKFDQKKKIEPIYSSVFDLKRAMFITIDDKSGKLRGCIGTLSLDSSILENVKIYSLATAFGDPRFSPMSKEEVFSDNFVYKVSILSALKDISLKEYLGDRFDIKRDGINIKNGAYFLNSVARDYGYNKTELLEQLCLKAGKDKKCYKSAELQYNEGYEFGLKEIEKTGGSRRSGRDMGLLVLLAIFGLFLSKN